MGWIVHIETVITVDGEEDVIEQSYGAQYFYSDCKKTVEYYEVSEEGERTLVRISCDNGGLKVERPDKAFLLDLGLGIGSIDYDTPAGLLRIRYRSKGYAIELSERGGIVSASYLLEMGGVMSRNRFTVSISKE